MSFLHGIAVTETAGARRSIAFATAAVIGLIATAPARNAAKYPADTPIAIGTPTGVSLAKMIEDAGVAGTLRGALEAIGDQVRCPIVLVIVDPVAGDVAATSAKVIGADQDGARTGMQALLSAEAQLGLRPRIVGAPGLDTEIVAGALAECAVRLRARAYALAIGDTRAEVAEYRENFAQRELMLVWPDLVTIEGGVERPRSAVACALGMRARIDGETGWHKTLSNVPIRGVSGLARPVSFDLQDPDSDAQLLNAAQVTTIVRVEGQLRFWGNRTCAPADGDFTFESAVATAQVLADALVSGLVWAIDKPLTPGLARDIVEEINESFRRLTRAGRILGATAAFDPDRNPVETLRVGQLVIGYRYTPVPPLELLGLEQEISDEFLADFATLVAVR